MDKDTQPFGVWTIPIIIFLALGGATLFYRLIGATFNFVLGILAVLAVIAFFVGVLSMPFRAANLVSRRSRENKRWTTTKNLSDNARYKLFADYLVSLGYTPEPDHLDRPHITTKQEFQFREIRKNMPVPYSYSSYDVVWGTVYSIRPKGDKTVEGRWAWDDPQHILVDAQERLIKAMVASDEKR